MKEKNQIKSSFIHFVHKMNEFEREEFFEWWWWWWIKYIFFWDVVVVVVVVVIIVDLVLFLLLLLFSAKYNDHFVLEKKHAQKHCLYRRFKLLFFSSKIWNRSFGFCWYFRFSKMFSKKNSLNADKTPCVCVSLTWNYQRM